MIEIVDINTSESFIPVVEALKESFRKYLPPSINEAKIIIINNFPCVGSMLAKSELLLFIEVPKKSRNYLRFEEKGKRYYLDNAIVSIRFIKESNVYAINEKEYFTSENTSFEYRVSNENNNWGIQDYISEYLPCRTFSCIYLESENDISFSNECILLNSKLTADFIFSSILKQWTQYRTGRIKSYDVERLHDEYDNSILSLCSRLIEDTDSRTKNGILTKKKLDRITTSTKVIDSIYSNVGNCLTIISGKAGTGKTLTLTRLIHKHVSQRHNVRFLTFNNLLAIDLKVTLRNFGYFSDNRLALGTIHSFFFDLSKKLGIPRILSQDRIDELLKICEIRFEKTRPTYEKIKNTWPRYNFIIKDITSREKNKADYEEFNEIAKFLSNARDFRSFQKLKSDYLSRKREILIPHVGNQVFIQDYYKVIELIYLALTNSKQFYDDLNIKNRYDLLATLYNTDKFISEDDEMYIPYENLQEQIKKLSNNSNWSKIIIVDEGQDCHVNEKEILYKLRGNENIIVASGGKEQLIRHNNLLNWSTSFGKKIPHFPVNLSGKSYRQKHNLVEFINAFSESFGFKLNLESIAESKGLGKVIIDCRQSEENQHLNIETLNELLNNGKLNGCSPYESMMIMVSSSYGVGAKRESFRVSDTDYVRRSTVYEGKKLIPMEEFDYAGILLWDGLTEAKYKLKPPFQDQTRIIHYESCRGLEAWTCICLGIEEFYNSKYDSDEAKAYMSDDLFLEEDDRRKKYAAIWTLMALTRPIDTLYIQIRNQGAFISRILLDIAKNMNGAIIHKN